MDLLLLMLVLIIPAKFEVTKLIQTPTVAVHCPRKAINPAKQKKHRLIRVVYQNLPDSFKMELRFRVSSVILV